MFFKRKLRTKLTDIHFSSDIAVDKEEVRDQDKIKSKCYVDGKRRVVDRDLQIGDEHF